MATTRGLLGKRSRVRGPERLEPRWQCAVAPVITEFLAQNEGGLQDGFGGSPDWIELYNPADEPLLLAGFHLTDNPERPTKWPLPAATMPPHAYWIVFASSQTAPDPLGYLHANFSLDADGEYLALTDRHGVVIQRFGSQSETFAPQKANVSYGVAQNAAGEILAAVGYMEVPTPGVANGDASQLAVGLVADTKFSRNRGYVDGPITVEISTLTPEAAIRYTTDGSAPSPTHGELYLGPLTIARTTTLRAIAFREHWVSTNVDTQTYVMLDDVLVQDGTGLPETWGTFVFGSTEAQQGAPVPANYRMDPEVVADPRYQSTLRDDLASLPVMSLVVDPDDLWGAERGIYSHPLSEGPAWERPASVEWFDPRGAVEFQIDAGVRIQGGFSRRPSATAKHSFRLFFNGEYGAAKARFPFFGTDGPDRFDTLVLRANYNYSWARGDRGGTQTGKDYTLVTDRWAADTQLAMGGLAPQQTFVHLYVNGLYWGVYNPTERPDASFQATHRGGGKDEYDVMNHEGVVAGDVTAWNQLLGVVAQRPLNMAAVESLMDVDNFIDYMILNLFGGNNDWPQNNWYASRRRSGDDRWQFHSWDAEIYLIGLNDNRVSSLPSEGPGRIFNRLRSDDEFRLRFADRVYQHFFHDGVLTAEANVARLDRLAAIVDRAVVAESARWGDAWMDQVSPPRTRDDDWLPRLEQLRSEYFPQRNAIVLNQFRAAQLYPSLDPPTLSQHGGALSAELPLRFAHDQPAVTVYLTTDGQDPRSSGGAVAPTAQRVTLDEPWHVLPNTHLLARAWDGQVWSPLVDVSFTLLGDVLPDGQLDLGDLELLCAAVQKADHRRSFDLNEDGAVDRRDVNYLVEDLLGTSAGDVNLDGIFDSADLVLVFQAGEYEDGVSANSLWQTGDWDCDGDFTTSDLVVAFQTGRYAVESRRPRTGPQ